MNIYCYDVQLIFGESMYETVKKVGEGTGRALPPRNLSLQVRLRYHCLDSDTLQGHVTVNDQFFVSLLVC